MNLNKIRVLILCLCVGACSMMVDKNTHDYPQASKDAFMSSCTSTSGGKEAACSCMLQKVEEHYTYGEMADIEQKLKTDQPPPEFTEFMNKTKDACAGAISTPQSSNSPQR